MCCFVTLIVCGMLYFQSSNCDAAPVPQTADQTAECPYELAKDFDDENPSPKKTADDIYRVPTSNRPVNHVDDKQILFRVSDESLDK